MPASGADYPDVLIVGESPNRTKYLRVTPESMHTVAFALRGTVGGAVGEDEEGRRAIIVQDWGPVTLGEWITLHEAPGRTPSRTEWAFGGSCRDDELPSVSR